MLLCLMVRCWLSSDPAVEVPCNETNDDAERTPYIERAVYLMLHDKSCNALILSVRLLQNGGDSTL
jgi:hypothetical protein